VCSEVRSVSCTSIMYSVFILVLCREVITVDCENRVELTNTVCWQSAEFEVLQLVHIVATVL